LTYAGCPENLNNEKYGHPSMFMQLQMRNSWEGRQRQLAIIISISRNYFSGTYTLSGT
jgi:hypothetical protein